jgi:hypothetical protein
MYQPDIFSAPVIKCKKSYCFAYTYLIISTIISLFFINLLLTEKNCGRDLLIIKGICLFFSLFVNILLSRCLCVKCMSKTIDIDTFENHNLLDEGYKSYYNKI